MQIITPDCSIAETKLRWQYRIYRDVQIENSLEKDSGNVEKSDGNETKLHLDVYL